MLSPLGRRRSPSGFPSRWLPLRRTRSVSATTRSPSIRPSIRRPLPQAAALAIALGLTAAVAPVAQAAGSPTPTPTPTPIGAPTPSATPGTPGTPHLTAVIFDTDIVLVAGRDFPAAATVNVNAAAGDLGGTATATSTAQGRLLLGFQLPEGFSDTVTLTARSGSASATTSLSVTVPTGSTPTPAPTTPPQPTTEPAAPAAPTGAGPAIPGQWKLVFGDEFDGTTLDRTKWQLCNPSFRALCLPWNNEKQIFRTEAQDNPNVVVSDGQLHLVATREGDQIYSGMVSTGPWPAMFGPQPAEYRGFSYTYGYYEGRVRMPKGKGFWPSLWALPWEQQQEGLGWPDTGEYDNVEIPGNNPSEYHFTAHWGGGSGECGHPCTPQVATISDASQNWHTYGFDWAPDGLTWYVDGQKMGKTVTDPAAIKDFPFYIIANFSVGGDWGPLQGGVDGSTPFPSSMDIDYLRVYQRA